jgi:hypothetical protein
LLAGFEVALALMLVFGATLMLRNMWMLHAVGSQLSPEQVLVARVTWMGANRSSGYAELVQRIEALPGVRAASLWNPGHQQAAPHFAGVPDPPPTAGNVVEIVRASPHHLAATGVRLLAGQWFEGRDTGLQNAVIVNEAFVRRYRAILKDPRFAIGRHFRLGQEDRTILGVVSDFRSNLDSDPSPLAILAGWGQGTVYGNEAQLLVRTSADPMALVPVIRKIAGLIQTLRVGDEQTLEEQMSATTAPRRFQAMLLIAFGCLGLALAIVGVYGVLNFAVTERTGEMGVRMALGASGPAILKLILSRASRIILTGGFLGLTGALLLGRMSANLFYGVAPAEGWASGLAGLVLLTAGFAAAYFPARRATRIDPVEALRYE